MSNPANQLPPEYDDYHPRGYDPAFTADISSKMRIPDRIGVDQAYTSDRTVDSLNKENLARDDMQRSAAMNVPDKIVVFNGDDRGEDAGPDLHRDVMTEAFMRQRPVDFSTPPQTIRVDERPFRYTDDEPPEAAEEESRLPNGGLVAHSNSEGLEEAASRVAPGNPLLIAGDDDAELAAVRRQVDKLTLHVFRLEEESATRKQHEMVLSSVVFGYIMFQMARWFLASK